MIELLRRLLPDPVRRALKPVYYLGLRTGRRIRMFFRGRVRAARRMRRNLTQRIRSARRGRRHRRGDDPGIAGFVGFRRRELRRNWRRLRGGVAITLRERGIPVPQQGRRRRRIAHLKRTLAVVRDDREQAKLEARHLRAELRRLRRRLGQTQVWASDPDDEWARQRMALGGGVEARDLAYFPGGAQNPYLRLLYSRCAEAGFEARPLQQYDHLDRMAGGSVFHLHWTRTFQAGAATELEARDWTESRLSRIEAFVGRGGHLLWSVHEGLPHDVDFPEVEISLRRRLVDLAAGIHVLHHATVDEVSDIYPLDPAKTFVVDHPLYTGVYSSYLTRSTARATLGIADDEVLLMGFGAIRPYKGFDRLVRLAPRLRAETGMPVRVMVAGPTYKTVDNRELFELAAATEGVSISGDPVPDDYVQVLFRAADVAVLPYRDVLNSGVLMLALTFGCPSVAPRNPVTADLVDSGLVHLFDRRSDDDLVRAIVVGIERRHERGVLPPGFTARYDHIEVAGRFADAVRSIVDGAAGGPDGAS